MFTVISSNAKKKTHLYDDIFGGGLWCFYGPSCSLTSQSLFTYKTATHSAKHLLWGSMGESHMGLQRNELPEVTSPLT